MKVEAETQAMRTYVTTCGTRLLECETISTKNPGRAAQHGEQARNPTAKAFALCKYLAVADTIAIRAAC